MIPSKTELIELYRRRAPFYDFTANLYYLIGFREQAYRQRAVRALNLQPGDTVVEVACGTGLNFASLHDTVGTAGRIIGVDLNDAMLAQADMRVRRQGWNNVELVHCNAADFDFPPEIDGVISTWAITLVPEFDDVIRRGVRALNPGGCFAILDFKRPDWAPLWLVKLFVAITAPFGVSLGLAERHPWASLMRRAEMFHREEFYLGFSYLVVGQSEPRLRPQEQNPRSHHDEQEDD